MLADIEHDFHQLLRAMRNEGGELHITCFFEELPLAGKLGEVWLFFHQSRQSGKGDISRWSQRNRLYY